MRAIVEALGSVVFAPECAACGAVLGVPLAGPVCASCWGAVRPLPPHLGEAASGAIARWRAGGEYEGALRAIVHAFKYDDRQSLATPLADRMRCAGADMMDGADCVVPVPLHPWRRFGRGFNQARLLAQRLGPPVVPALWRVRWTPTQAGLEREARARNVRDAFRLSPLLRPSVRDRHLSGRIVTIIDDVRTTGATLDACAQILHAAGASQVRALVAAAVL